MKVGDYVRTEISSLNFQRIGKIKKIISEDFIHTDIGTYDKEYIVKSSPNIIDLIEVGDYVNGVEVIGFEKDNFNNEYLQCGVGDYVVCTYYETSIKSILTKEQFESMEYKV